MEIEKHYVHEVYSRLAEHCSATETRRDPRVWPKVKQFIKEFPPGSVVIDIGCGQAKYKMRDGLLIGSDTCPEVLRRIHPHEHTDVHLGDALHLPYRDDSVDGVLLVSVIHHFTTFERRRKAVAEAARCLVPKGRMIIYVWAFEQPSAAFPSQDLLVPWHLHENPSNGRAPLVKFHMDSTKEQRIIQDSIAINVSEPQNNNGDTLGGIVKTFFGRFLKVTRKLPPALPRFIISPRTPRRTSFIYGISKWSPMLGRKLASAMKNVEELVADELAEQIMTSAIAEALSTLQKVTFYRFYHVFKKDELEELVATVPTLKIISVDYEHANWYLIAEKSDNFDIDNNKVSK